MSETMTSRDRVLAAMDHRTADRVPMTFDAEKEVYEALAARLGTETKEGLFDRLGVDTWYVGMRGRQRDSAAAAGDRAPAAAETDGLWGFRTRVVHYEGGSYGELCYSPLAGKDEIADIDAHRWPGPDAVTFDHCAAEIAAHRNRAVVGTFGWGAYFRATWVRGMEDLMMDMALRPRYAEHLIRTIADCTLAHLDGLLATCGPDLDIVYMADDYCSQLGPLFSPEVFRRMIVPYLRAATDRVHACGKKFLLHCCGAVRPLLPMIIEAGVDLLEPIQIRAAGMEPAGLKRDFGRDLCFWGGLDLQHVLCKGSPQEVADEARRLIDILGADGGYIFGPGHTYIQVDAPVDNILAMYQTGRTHRLRTGR
ncbi:MAG TPA: uroporphyrinogen decarboxylase family protein [Phycisphaerae bacterium]|nr:hypothetical protein [Phycisphaerae bacterium]HOI53917.1 uroporphyrinogen decarboxylase family protein [Phycisphaerae bacterium]